MFKTPNLHSFMVTWYLQPSQFPGGQIMGSEEFLALRFIEDLADGDPSVALVVEEVRIPMDYDRTAGHDVAVSFEVISTEPYAKELIQLGYKVRPLHPELMTTKWDDPGMTWDELSRMLRHDIGHREVPGDEEALFTDDTDPDAPWYRARCIKKDDRGWFLALEVIE